MSSKLASAADHSVETECVFSGRRTILPCATLVLVTEKLPNDALFQELNERSDSTFKSLQIIGDGLAPGLIADAVYAGHLAARDFQRDPEVIEQELFRREMPSLPF